MKLLRAFSRSKPQPGEDRIGGGLLGLPLDPVLYPGQAFRRLMNVVAIGDVGKGLKQLLKALALVQNGRGCRMAVAGGASWRAHGRQNFFDVVHPRAFPRGIPTQIQNLSAAG
jgi:hypothetical protein